jgi:outer membrane autotransporter protein
VAAAIDQLRPASGKSVRAVEAPLFDSLDEESVGGDDVALGALSGQGHAALPGAIMAGFSGFSNAIADRQSTIVFGGGGAQTAPLPSVGFSYGGMGSGATAQMAASPVSAGQPAPKTAGQWTTWGQVYNRWSNVGSSAGLPGFSSSGGGFVLGADGWLGSDLVVGGALDYTHASTDSAGVTGASDIYTGGAYALYTPGAFVFAGRVMGGATTTSTNRGVDFPGESPTANGSMNGWGGLAAGEVGYRFNVKGATLEPYAGLTAQTLSQRGFTESTSFGLDFPSQSYGLLTSAVGIAASETFQAGAFTFMPVAKVAWTHELRNDTLTTQAALFDAPFTIAAANPGRDAALVGLQLAVWQTENVRVFATYTGQFSRNATSQQVAGGVRIAW